MNVDNTSSVDSVFSMKLDGATTATVMAYSRKGEKTTISGIPDGTYQAYVTSGVDWDPNLKAFTRSCHYGQVGGDTPTFKSNASSYTVVSLTLHPVVGVDGGGGLDSADFPR